MCHRDSPLTLVAWLLFAKAGVPFSMLGVADPAVLKAIVRDLIRG